MHALPHQIVRRLTAVGAPLAVAAVCVLSASATTTAAVGHHGSHVTKAAHGVSKPPSKKEY